MQEEGFGLAKIRLPKKIEFPIDNEGEAILYAKQDSEVRDFIEGWSAEGFRIHFWAHFDEDDNFWAVGIYPDDEIEDIWFEIHFKPDSTIIHKGPGVGA